MSDYKNQKPTELEETLSRLLDIQAQPGADQDGNLLLLSLVNLMGILSVMQKQLTSQENDLPLQSGVIDKQQEEPGVNCGNGVTDINIPRRKVTDLKAIENDYRNGYLEKRKNNDKIVNKINRKSEGTSSKVIKWDSRLNKKIKEPLYI